MRFILLSELQLHYTVSVIWPILFFRLAADGAELSHPDSYQRTSSKEQRVLACVDNFRRQYVYIYPDRRPLMLVPLNECNVQV